MRFLIENNVDVGVVTPWGGSALQSAAASGSIECAKLLLKGGADINSKDSRGWTPLMSACDSSGTDKTAPDEVVELLIRNNASIHLVNEKGQSALALAARSAFIYSAWLLLKAGADINIKDSYGDTPLIKACSSLEGVLGIIDMVRFLISNNGDVRLANFKGRSALAVAIRNISLDCIELLLKVGADIDSKDVDGETPLMKACQRSGPKLSWFLIERGATIHDAGEDRKECLSNRGGSECPIHGQRK